MAFSFNPTNPSKRYRSYSDGEKSDGEVVGTWSRYLVVEAEDPEKPLTKLSPFAIAKGFQGVSSSIKNVKKMYGGAFLVECPTERASKNLLGRSGGLFVDCKVKVTPHKSLNSCKGVIYCKDLDETTTEEIVREMSSQGVTEVHRLSKKQGETKVQTHTYFLTFALSAVPETVKIGFLRCKVSVYVPAPMRCFKCQKFGHSSHKCKNNPVCERCGHQAHENACSQPPKCSNCKGDHSPRSKDCPTFKFEQEIQAVRTKKKLSFQEAKKEVEQYMNPSKKSFACMAASGAKPACRTQGVQAGNGIPAEMLKKLRKDLKDGRKMDNSVQTQRQPGCLTQPTPGSTKGSTQPKSGSTKGSTQPTLGSPNSAPTTPGQSTQRVAQPSGPNASTPAPQAVEAKQASGSAPLTPAPQAVEAKQASGSAQPPKPLRDTEKYAKAAEILLAHQKKEVLLSYQKKKAKYTGRTKKAERNPIFSHNLFDSLPEGEDMDQ